MWGWIFRASVKVASFLKGAALFAYSHPIIGAGIGLATKLIHDRVRRKAESTGYIPVLTEAGSVFGFMASTFEYALATGLAARAVRELIGEAPKKAAEGLYERLMRAIETLAGGGHRKHGTLFGTDK